jgi:hypothetical protein
MTSIVTALEHYDRMIDEIDDPTQPLLTTIITAEKNT